MNTLARPVFLACALVGVVLLVGFVAVLVLGATGLFGQTPGPPLDLTSLLGSSLLTSAMAFVFTVPIGLCSALYLSEFASVRTRRWLESPLQFLARVPPVVYGYFAVSTFLPALEKVVPALHDYPSVRAGIALSGMLIPSFSEHTRAAIATVPQHLRDGACALGAGKFVTAWFVVLPAVQTRLFGALVGTASRAIGETMIVLFVLQFVGQSFQQSFQQSLLSNQTSRSDSLATFFVPNGTGIWENQVPKEFFIVGSVLLVVTFLLELTRSALNEFSARRNAA